MRKKIDDKIKILMENAIHLNERSMFVIVGDRGRDQVIKYYIVIFPLDSKPSLFLYKIKSRKEIEYSLVLQERTGI
jgi:N-acetyltransferase 10